MKQEIAKIIYGDAFEGDGLSFTNKNDLTMEQSREIADQILDLILSKIVIEKKAKVTIDPFNMGSIMLVGEVNGYNKCIDQLEEIKNKLRE